MEIEKTFSERMMEEGFMLIVIKMNKALFSIILIRENRAKRFLVNTNTLEYQTQNIEPEDINNFLCSEIKMGGKFTGLSVLDNRLNNFDNLVKDILFIFDYEELNDTL